MGRGYSTNGTEKNTNCWSEDLGVDERMIIDWILWKQGGKV